MGQQSFVYSFVARGTVVLAEYKAFPGNASEIAQQCLEKTPATADKVTYTSDKHTFNYLLEGGFAYLVVADESLGRQLPYAFLERVKDDFKKRYGGGKADTAQGHSLDREFGPKLKEHMQYVTDHPDEMNKLSKIKAQVEQVKGVMADNIEKVLQRGEKIEILVDKSQLLQDQANLYQTRTKQLKNKFWLQNMKIKLVVLLILAVLALVIWVSICRGFTCK